MMRLVLVSKTHVKQMRNIDLLNDVVKNVTPGKYLMRLKKKPHRRSSRNNQSVLTANFVSNIKFSYTNQEQRKYIID